MPTGESDLNTKDNPLMNALEESLKWKLEAEKRK